MSLCSRLCPHFLRLRSLGLAWHHQPARSHLGLSSIWTGKPTLRDGRNLIKLDWFRADCLEPKDETAHSESLHQDPEPVLSGRPPPLFPCLNAVCSFWGACELFVLEFTIGTFSKFSKVIQCSILVMTCWLPDLCGEFLLCVTGDLLCRYASG